MTFALCCKPIKGRSRYEELIERKCYLESGHDGPCNEYPYLSHLREVAPRVEAKITPAATQIPPVVAT
jgi:hypothetical protein